MCLFEGIDLATFFLVVKRCISDPLWLDRVDSTQEEGPKRRNADSAAGHQPNVIAVAPLRRFASLASGAQVMKKFRRQWYDSHACVYTCDSLQVKVCV